jgi:tetratricopeptide (TPR) repeat protein
VAQLTLGEVLARARDYLEDDQPAVTIAVVRRLLEAFPQHLDAYCLLGEACLAAGDYVSAVDCFQRVLSSDPESLTAHAGLAMICEETAEYAEALWHWERAFELAPANPAIRERLHKLYAWRDGRPPRRIGLTRAALARLYARTGENRRAIAEYDALLDEDPERVDIEAALSEALWRAGRAGEAAETARSLMGKLPYSFKANLLAAAAERDRDDGEACLLMAEALDPENRHAQALLGPGSPLSPRDVLAPVEVMAALPAPQPKPAPEPPPSPAEPPSQPAVEPTATRASPLWQRLMHRILGT